MIDSIAFQSGIFLGIATAIFTCLHWVLASLNGLRIEKVGILQDPYFSLYKTKVNSIELILGWIPLGSYVKISGMVDERMDRATPKEPEEYEFRGKPFWTRFFIMLSSPILLTLIGGLILLLTSNIPVWDILLLYIKASFFIIPIEAGDYIWQELYTNPVFLMGFIFLILGISNLFTNLSSILDSETKNIISIHLFLIFVMFFFTLILFRLAWINFALMNILFYFLGVLLVGIVAIFISFFLAKFLPNH
jgi:hypothetical protein